MAEAGLMYTILINLQATKLFFATSAIKEVCGHLPPP